MRSHSINAKAELTRERQRAPESGRTGERERGRERAAKLTSLGGEFSALSFRNSARSHSEPACSLVCVSLFLSRTTSLPSLLYLCLSLSLTLFVANVCVRQNGWKIMAQAQPVFGLGSILFYAAYLLCVCILPCVCVSVCVWVCLIYAATVCASVLLFGLPAVWI